MLAACDDVGGEMGGGAEVAYDLELKNVYVGLRFNSGGKGK